MVLLKFMTQYLMQSLDENIAVRTQFGSDSGLARYHVVDKDGLNGNSKTYYK